ncbi:MAG: ABC transporter permease [Anaerolineae bacterium]|nr:ABC transporter permease [Anaerolineae bacterium]
MKTLPATHLFLILALVFLLGPFLIIFIASFGAESTLAFPPSGFSLQWFEKVFSVRMFRDAFVTSLQVAVAGTTTALLLGIPAAYALVRFQFPGKDALELLFSSPAIVPGLVVGLALLRFFVLVSGLPVLLGLYLGHTAILFPYSVRVVSGALRNLDPSIEEAAQSLGASRARSFLLITLPNIRSGIMAAFILAFITSFNNVPISLFLTGPGVATLPIQMMLYMEYYFDPTIAALSTILIVFTVVIVQGTERALNISTHI